MVGPVSVVGSSVVDSHATPCLFLDAVSSCNLSSGDLVLQRSSFGKKRVRHLGSLDLSTSFLHSSSIKALTGANNRKKQSKMRKLVIFNELAGQYEDTFEDVKTEILKGPYCCGRVHKMKCTRKLSDISTSSVFSRAAISRIFMMCSRTPLIPQILNYFTYKAVRTVLNQLYEMNPTQYRWFYDFVASNENGYGKRFLRNLGKEKHDLAERVMVTRLHLYGKWVKKCDHTEMYERISDENLQLLRERLVETVIWPSDDTNSEVAG